MTLQWQPYREPLRMTMFSFLGVADRAASAGPDNHPLGGLQQPRRFRHLLDDLFGRTQAAERVRPRPRAHGHDCDCRWHPDSSEREPQRRLHRGSRGKKSGFNSPPTGSLVYTQGAQNGNPG